MQWRECGAQDPLGTMDNSLKNGKQVQQITTKANRTVGFIAR